MPLSGRESKRKLVHIAVGVFAFLLRYLSWPQAALMAVLAFFFNWQVLPRLGGKQLWREDEAGRGYPLGILLYPLAVLGLVLVFRHDLWMAAAVWGVLAFGDGMATIVGQGVGSRALPWNANKSWAGLLAFVLFGTLGASVLAAWTLRLPLSGWASPFILGLTVPLVLVCAAVETIPTRLDDNLTVPLVGAVVLPLLAGVDAGALLAEPDLTRRLLLGLGVNAAISAVALRARAIDLPGAVSAVVIGTAITLGLGLEGLALMIAFFVLGSLTTRLGYAKKARRGIAQEKEGARGWRNAWANGGVPAALALLAGLGGGPRRALLTLAYAASVATAAADTCSSEVGKAFGRRTFVITTLRPVPPGTEGAISLEGTLAGLAGALAVGLLGAALGLYSLPAALLVALAGLLGSLAESVVGTVAERRGWLDNDLLNALNTALGAGLVLLLARLA